MNSEKLTNEPIKAEKESVDKTKRSRIFDIIAYLLCLAVSFGIWAYVVMLENENFEYTFENVLVQLEGINELKNDKDLSIISGYDQTVSITVVGSRKEILKYTAEDIFARVDLGSVSSADRYSLNVDVELPENMKLVLTEPSRINVFVDETATTTVDLKINLLYNVATDLTIHEPEPSVDKITVTGPKTVIETIAGAEITYDLGSVTTSVNFNATVVLVDEDGNDIGNPYIKTDVADVMVKVPVTMEKTLPLVAHYTANDTDRFTYTVTFTPATVKVTGDPRTVAEMTAVEVNVDDITNSPGGSVTTENNLILPENVKLFDKSIKTVSYLVEKSEMIQPAAEISEEG